MKIKNLTNLIYDNLFYNKLSTQKYTNILDKIFSDISKKNLNGILKYNLYHKPIKRIN